MLPSWILAKEITIECIKAEKTTDIPNIFHKIYSNEENRKILISIFFKTSSASNKLLAGLSFFIGAWYVFQKLIGLDLPQGFPTTILVISFFAGIQLLGLGLIGEYVGRIYDEVKRRPKFIVDKKINFTE